MDNGVRQYAAGTPAFKQVQEQFKPLEDSQLTENPMFPEYDALVTVPSLDEIYDWQQAAHIAFRVVATRQPYFTTDDVYGELLRVGIKDPPDKRVMGNAVLSARQAHIMVDDGGPPVPSTRAKSHYRPIRRYRSLLFLQKKLDESLRENETKPIDSIAKPSRTRNASRARPRSSEPETKELSASDYWKTKGRAT